MKKVFISIIIGAMLGTTLIGCGSEAKQVNSGKKNSTEKTTSNKDVESKENKECKDIKVSKEEIVKVFDGYKEKMKDALQADGLKPSEFDKSIIDFIKNTYVGGELEEEGVPNKINYAGLSAMLGNNGTISFDVMVKYYFNPDDIKSGKKLDMREMNIEKYTNVFLDDYKVDYEKLNAEINKILADENRNTDSYELYELKMEDGYSADFSIYEDEIDYQIINDKYLVK